jgi:spore maturation protein CgeB
MKILIIGNCYEKYRMEYSIRKAFIRLGHKVIGFNDRRLKKIFGFKMANNILWRIYKSFKPDFIYVSLVNHIDTEILREMTLKCKSVMWNYDWEEPFVPKHLEVAKCVDVLFITNLSQIEDYLKAGVKRVEFLPQACDSKLHYKLNYKVSKWLSDVAFIGSGESNFWDRSVRINLLRKVAREFNLKIYGPHWERYKNELPVINKKVKGKKFLKICAYSKINLGVIGGNGAWMKVKMGTSNRLWLVLGCGGFYLGFKNPGLDLLLKDNFHLAFYESDEECIDKIKFYLKNDSLREKIAQNGYEFVHKYHTYDNRVHNLLNMEGYKI